MKVISATVLEDYHWNRDNEYGNLEVVERRIMVDDGPNLDMLRGSALHAVLEDPERYRGYDGEYPLLRYKEGDFVQEFAAASIYQLRDEIGTATHEVRASFEVDDLVRVSCKCDGLYGNRGDEYKCPRKPIDLSQYEESYQWRIYAHAFGVAQIRYHIVRLDIPKRNPIALVKDYKPLDLYAYTNLARDVEELVREFWMFVEERSLEPYFREAEEDDSPWARTNRRR
ncbi:MAG: hypothetical protein OES13_00210 [Acidimicrobiia bacterium]|nr:hypothetical protein [Acidimicrobiia bacterium]